MSAPAQPPDDPEYPPAVTDPTELPTEHPGDTDGDDMDVAESLPELDDPIMKDDGDSAEAG